MKSNAIAPQETIVTRVNVANWIHVRRLRRSIQYPPKWYG